MTPQPLIDHKALDEMRRLNQEAATWHPETRRPDPKPELRRLLWEHRHALLRSALERSLTKE